MRGPEFVKGHGTENDFVVLPDEDGLLDLTPERVRALCDRQRGLGADGVLRVVRAGHVADAPEMPGETWFMDYRNADGSVAEMCGNGVRVFARFLADSGLAAQERVAVGTRAGLRPVVLRPDGQVAVDMGPVRWGEHSRATLGDREFAGVAVDVGNPHLACVTETDVAALDLAQPVGYDGTLFPQGVNIEWVRPDGPDSVVMRVHERGVGETRSCGTGTVAATAAALRAGGASVGRRAVHVLGGTVEVEITESTSTLTGPVVFTARGQLDADWWGRVGQPRSTAGKNM